MSRGDGKTPEKRERERAERVRRLRGRLDGDADGSIEYWSNATPAEHARAMIELSRYAEKMSAQTGFRRDPYEKLPRLQPRESIEANRDE